MVIITATKLLLNLNKNEIAFLCYILSNNNNNKMKRMHVC